MRRLTIVLTTCLLLLGAAAAALADDFMPAAFRGDPLSVMAEWDFVSDFNPDHLNIDPDYLNTVGDGYHALGTAYTHCHASDEVTWVVDPDDPLDGVAITLGLPGQLDFFLVNFTDDYSHKHIWIQITYSGQGVPFVSSVVGPNPATNTWTDPTYGMPGGQGIEADPNRRVEYWVLMPNPDREHVYIDLPPFTTVDQVVIDTVSTNLPVQAEDSSWGQVKALFR